MPLYDMDKAYFAIQAAADQAAVEKAAAAKAVGDLGRSTADTNITRLLEAGNLATSALQPYVLAGQRGSTAIFDFLGVNGPEKRAAIMPSIQQEIAQSYSTVSPMSQRAQRSALANSAINSQVQTNALQNQALRGAVYGTQAITGDLQNQSSVLLNPLQQELSRQSQPQKQAVNPRFAQNPFQEKMVPQQPSVVPYQQPLPSNTASSNRDLQTSRTAAIQSAQKPLTPQAYRPRDLYQPQISATQQASLDAMMKYGQKSVENSLAARGMLGSGNAVSELQQMGAGIAGQYIIPQYTELTAQAMQAQSEADRQVDSINAAERAQQSQQIAALFGQDAASQYALQSQQSGIDADVYKTDRTLDQQQQQFFRSLAEQQAARNQASRTDLLKSGAAVGSDMLGKYITTGANLYNQQLGAGASIYSGLSETLLGIGQQNVASASQLGYNAYAGQQSQVGSMLGNIFSSGAQAAGQQASTGVGVAGMANAQNQWGAEAEGNGMLSAANARAEGLQAGAQNMFNEYQFMNYGPGAGRGSAVAAAFGNAAGTTGQALRNEPATYGFGGVDPLKGTGTYGGGL